VLPGSWAGGSGHSPAVGGGLAAGGAAEPEPPAPGIVLDDGGKPNFKGLACTLLWWFGRAMDCLRARLAMS
jgi:hypothetical protein